MRMRFAMPTSLGLTQLVLLTVFACAPPPAGEKTRKSLCSSNLRVLGSALLEYRREKGHFPPSVIRHEASGNAHSWRVALLPYIEEDRLFKAYRLDEPWDSQANSQVTAECPELYRCFSNYDEPDGHANYFRVVRESAVARDNGAAKAPQKSILIVEVANANIHWAEPRDIAIEEMSYRINDAGSLSVSSHHPDGAHVLRCDGSVEFLSNELSEEEVRGLLTQ